jgi:hypothetical protein
MAGERYGSRPCDRVAAYRVITVPLLLGGEAIGGDRQLRFDPAQERFSQRQVRVGGSGGCARHAERTRRFVPFALLQQGDAATLVNRCEIELRQALLGRMQPIVLDGTVAILQELVIGAHVLERFQRAFEIVPHHDRRRVLPDGHRRRFPIVQERGDVIAIERADLSMLGNGGVESVGGGDRHNRSTSASVPWVPRTCCSQSAAVRVKFPLGPPLPSVTAARAAGSVMSPKATSVSIVSAGSLTECRTNANRWNECGSPIAWSNG